MTSITKKHHSFTYSDNVATLWAVEEAGENEDGNWAGYFCISMVVILPLLTYLGGQLTW